MGREDDCRPSTRQCTDHLPGSSSRRGIETRGGLVEEEQTRVPDDAKPEVQAALLTTGERLHPVVCLVCEPNELDHLVNRPRIRVVAGIARERLADREERLDGKLLEHNPHAFPQLAAGCRVCRVITEHENVTAVSLAKALEDLDDRGLACAVRPEQREDLALVHLEGDVPYCFGPLVGLCEMFNRDSGHATSPGSLFLFGP